MVERLRLVFAPHAREASSVSPTDTACVVPPTWLYAALRGFGNQALVTPRETRDITVEFALVRPSLNARSDRAPRQLGGLGDDRVAEFVAQFNVLGRCFDSAEEGAHTWEPFWRSS